MPYAQELMGHEQLPPLVMHVDVDRHCVLLVHVTFVVPLHVTALAVFAMLIPTHVLDRRSRDVCTSTGSALAPSTRLYMPPFGAVHTLSPEATVMNAFIAVDHKPTIAVCADVPHLVAAQVEPPISRVVICDHLGHLACISC